MTIQLLLFVYGVAAIVAAVIAGVFLTFSDFVMTALRAASPQSGAEAMQQINRKVYGSAFLVLLLGMAPASLGLAVYAWFFLQDPAAIWMIAGAVVYLVGVVLVTMICNVPMNKRLDVMDHTTAKAQGYWSIYAVSWTLWNHVRTIASGASAVCFFVGCVLLAAG